MLDRPQVKICGLTSVSEAVACAQSGAHAIGCVFYPPSPRHLTVDTARDICLSLPPEICTVGVFVDADFSKIMHTVEYCGLKAVQLHGSETAELVSRLCREGIFVFKTLFINREPSLQSVDSYTASAYILESAGGKLPGGNAKAWNWDSIGSFALNFPTILAGGLHPGNIAQAVDMASPDAVDVSSGVESEPGRKDIDKVKRFIDAVQSNSCSRELRRIFQ